jgi:predicted ATPase/class 3 adenylate cyclase
MSGSRASPLVTGTVTFLFTDIERSTENVARLGNERYAELLAIHRRLLRGAFAAHDGIEVGTDGDAFFIAFAKAVDAVAAAVAGQRALESYAWPGEERLRVRIGLHTGEPLVSEDDYVGHDVHLAKRVSDAGHGGQIILSQTTRDLVAGHVPDGVTITDLGLHRLKDLGDPQRVYQLVAADLQRDFPHLRSLDVAEHNLPVQLTSFVGRQDELRAVEDMLANCRLVTLTGVGGSGKTRLAIHAAAAEVDRSPDGVFFCDLSRISDEEALAPTIAGSLAIDMSSDGGSVSAVEAVRGLLRPRNALLILDNCEHLVDAVAALVEDLLKACPGLRILATSREALEVDGERSWSVPSLDITGDGAQLFAERAAAVRGGFTLTEASEPQVHAICERLDGMPLAIELAAAQMSHLGAGQIAERLDERFLLITGGRRRVQRQQTLHATLDWSWDLLDDQDRVLLPRLAVFQGGFALEAAEAVCGGGLDAVAGLRSLVAKSLVVADARGDSVRYRLLEAVRLYAEDKLGDAAEVEDVRTRHRDHYLAWVEAMFDKFGPFHPYLGTLYEAEQDNLRAALRWSEADGRPDLVAELLLMSNACWLYHWVEGIRRIEAALTTRVEPTVRGRLLSALSSLEIMRGDGDSALAHAGEALRLLGDEASAWSFTALQTTSLQLGIDAVAKQNPTREDDAVAFARRTAQVGQALQPGWAVSTHLALGHVMMMLLRHAEAAEAYATCIRETPPDRFTTWQPAEGLWVARHICPDAWTESLAAALREGTERCVRLSGYKSTHLALDAALRGDVDQAREILLSNFYERNRRFSPPLVMRQPIIATGLVAAALEDWEAAAKLLAAGFAPGIILSASGYALYRHWLPLVRAQVDPQRARQLRDEGRAMSLDEALAYALENVP